MKPLPYAVLASLGWLLVLAVGPAAAQVPYQRPPTNPYPRPTVNPYLNLLRPGGTPTSNYFELVRPQTEFRSNIQQLQRETTRNEQAIAEQQDASTLPATGHATQFLSYAKYFQNRGGQAPGGSAGLVAPQRTTAPPQRRPTTAGVAGNPRSGSRSSR